MFSRSGFVLPTVAMLLVLMSLIVGSLLFRTSSRTTQVMAEREEQVIYNAATPAIDRAKAKLEYLFTEDPRLPGGLASDDMLESMVLNDGSNGVPVIDNDPVASGDQNPYLLPDETPLDLDNDGTLDSGWSFETDTDGDGTTETVAYSILSRTVSGTVDRTDSDDDKADELVVRNAPINLIRSSNPACADISRAPQAGWDPISSATVRRAFQVTALVVDSDNAASRTVTTLEMQQDRQADQGNKWGAWFRNDLEIFPGPGFYWNGAIHTEGNLIIGDSDNFRAYLISSPASCLYSRANSEVTIGGNSDGTTPPFLGQMINGSIKRNNYNGGSRFDLYGENGASQTFSMNAGKDSVDPPQGTDPADMTLDPVVLFTTNNNQARSGNPNNAGVRDDDWKDGAVVTEGRIINRFARAPYVDDTYRADSRYGPKPEYNDVINPFIDQNGNPTGRKVGDSITSADPDQSSLTNTNPTQVDALGLDGYWERRAWAEGLRIIVGQRLELGNTYGWEGNNDPLYSPQSSVTTTHEQRQWKTLRDNLAAVQSTAVYHSAGANRNFPLACLAMTAHPGTPTTMENSTTFSRVDISGTSRINTDFLTGNGTNGWEFEPPATGETAFANSVADDQPLGIALRNLAHFAGDPFGGFPPRQDTRDGINSNDAVPSVGPVVHPYPNLQMWGDFSNLRRVMTQLDSGTSYANLSVADKTTLHTASCTLGMLAYNLQTEIQAYEDALDSSSLQSAGVDLSKLVDGTSSAGNPEIEHEVFGSSYNKNTDWTDPDSSTVIPDPENPGNYICAPGDDTTGYQDQCDAAEFYAQFTKEQWLDAAGITGTDRDEIDEIATTIALGNQILRDRALGFKEGSPPPPPGTPNGVFWDSNTGLTGQEQVGGATVNLQTSCDPDIYSDVTASGGGGGSNDRAKLALALTFCGEELPVKFPSLYYLFPRFDHDQNGADESSSALGVNHQQPSTESYIDDPYIFNDDPMVTDDVNDGFTYEVPGDTDNSGIEDGSENSISAIAIEPRPRVSWVLPKSTTTSGRVNIIDDDGTDVAVALLDKGMFNGREMMSIRSLDLDLDLLRRNSINGETWLPNSGIIYAFREDAVREDGIARPRVAAWNSCDTAAEITNSTCRMNAVGSSPQDPPVNPITGISPKPVDFYADPDRRPYGFRLRKGEDLRRIPAPPTDFALRGMAFISDNPVYIVGDDRAFNLHNDASSGDRIEEFTNLLDNDWGDFYDRGVNSGTLNTNFARAGDTWRPAEIIADAVTILSEDFVDGSIAEGIRRQNVGDRSSYRTLNAPDNQNRPWVREDGSTSNDVNADLPIKISRNGFPLYGASEIEYGRSDGRTYMDFNDGKDRIDVNAGDDTRINATIVSGLIPSRAEQSYGGFHNFPRFIEKWSNEDLHISGAFVQLNFSSYATAPFDQDSWEPGDSAQSAELIRYYGAPNRRWGYDVGLQYSPAGPVAERFITPSNTRSEFYRELPLEDPYVLNLRCAEVSGNRIDPSVDTASCPS